VARVDGLLLDLDGVLIVSWEPIDGAVGAIERLRRDRIPFRLITNTTTHSRRGLAERLGAVGFDVRGDEIVTAVTATAGYIRERHRDATAFVLTDGDPGEDLEGVPLAARPEDADVMVIGGASEAFDYDVVNRIFRRVKDGAALVGMHRNLSWRTERGWELDGGAYLAGLEEAADVRAAICGKPAPAFFEAALHLLGVPAMRAAMVGDDVASDVMGAKAVGCAGILVRTGKYQEGDELRGAPDAVLGGLRDVPGWIAAG
jgi:HAD superfamily hydrolase (TIGR01458 family)